MTEDYLTEYQGELPDTQIGFFELGMDSLMAVELHARLSQLLKVSLPSTLVFDFPNIERLTQYIASEVLHLNVHHEGQQSEAISDNILNEPIAIIGMGCSFPGGASDPDRFWQILEQGIDTCKEIPRERWDIDTFYDPDPAAPGKMLTRYGHFVAAVDQFDPAFFGISPREATALDPQHRLLLEVSWQALERAGQALERLAGAPVGVFVGTNAHDYEQLLQQHLQQEPDSPLSTYSSTGTHPSGAAGRLAYTFGFTGPAVTLDTACSASLVAIHQACNSLRLGECQMAITGGVLLNLTPETYISTSRARMISPDGQCKTFDASADGYARGEGCGIVVLKRLSQAQQDGDTILALIRGSAVNQDGPSSGLTVPNGQAQQKLIKQALVQAQIKPAEISYLEAHGTGTSLGDPIEVNAATALLGKERSLDHPLWIGSVKTNIGHLEAAAGISGLIKVVLSMQQQKIPAHLHLHEPNPQIDWQPWLKVPQTLTPWTVSERRLAGVSSFGFTGTNAHVVLEEAPVVLAAATTKYERSLHLLKISAKNDKALAELAQSYGHHLEDHPEQALEDICFTANIGRLSYSHRLSVVAQSRTDLQEKLHAFVTGKESTGLVTGIVNSSKSRQVAFLFSGQGSQYIGMGRQLYETQPTFKKALDQCAEILIPYLDRPLLDILYSADTEDAILAQTAYTQPALFALEYALYQLWHSWGIQPTVVMGHSVGEYVAACVAGVFSLEDGLKLIATRGRLMQQLPAGGAMVSLLAPVAQVKEFISSQSEVAIAAINGPESTVISGSVEVINTVVTQLESAGIKSKTLQVSHAFHSPLMQPMVAEFEQVARQITYAPPRVKLISNVTSHVATHEIATPEYWCNHILAPVNFAAGMATLQQQGCEVFLECGPKPILLGMGRQCLPNSEGVWLPSLRPGQEDWQQLLTSLSELYVQGVNVNWQGFDQDYLRRKVILPTYPFQRERYWVETQSPQTKEPSPSTSSQVLDLLSQGDVDQLVRLLNQDGQSAVDLEVLERLVKLHQQQQSVASVQDLIYELQWVASELSNPNENTQPQHWLIFANSGNLAATLVEQLQQIGQTCSLVTLKSSPPEESLCLTYTLQLDNLAAFDSLWSQLQQTPPISGIVWLGSLGETATPSDLTPSALESEVNALCEPLLFLMQSLVKQSDLAQTKLWVVTENGVACGSDLPTLSMGPLWGLSRIFGLEHPKQWGGLIDLDRQTSVDEQAQALVAEVIANQTEEQVAYRETNRFVARLMPSPLSQRQPIFISPEGSYLISGGLGGLGLTVAQWLVERGARHLVLLSRSGVNTPSKQAAVTQLESAGAQVMTPTADISDEEALVTVLQCLSEQFLPLRGIIHAAGLEGGAYPIKDLEPGNLAQTLRPKVRGTWNLHQLTSEWELDFFVNFSSIASVWGSLQQAHYGAANEFQNLFAQYRQVQGQPVLTVNWSAIEGAGMMVHAGEQILQRLSQMGVGSLSLSQLTAALELLLSGEGGQRVVASVDWQKLDLVYQAGRPRALLEYLVEQEELIPKEQSASETSSTSHCFDELLEATPEEQKEYLITYLQNSIARVLGFRGDQLPAIDQDLLGLGMDSLMMMQVLAQLRTDLQLMFYPREFYDRPRIDALAEYLATEFAQVHCQSSAEALLSQSDKPGVALEVTSRKQKTPARQVDQPPLPGITFVLSPPRSGSTLLRVMLAGHPTLFSPPELHLLSFTSMAERGKQLAATYLQEGLQTALIELMDLDAASSAALLQDMESKDLSIYEAYAYLQERAGNRLIIDKSPSYALAPETLQRAEEIFQGAKYIHLTRHPYAAIESFARLRLDKLMGMEWDTPHRVAEQVWLRSNRNILNFTTQLERERYHLIQYENLVRQPERELRRLCEFLQIDFVPELLQPYKGERMLKGVHATSAHIGDPNFFNHNHIEASLAETWKQIDLPHLLTQETRQMADRLEYFLPKEKVLLESSNSVEILEEVEL